MGYVLGGSRSTKPCVFPCKVAAGDDERYLVCAAVAAGVGLPFFGVLQNACVLQSANLRNLLQRKVEEEGNLESQNLRIDIGFEEMAALKHSLKIALHVYDALQNSRCFACRRSIPTEDSALVVSKP